MNDFSPYRLPPAPGQIIDRGSPLRFTFEGRKYPAFAGDSLASALAANGVRVFSRSFKYHRPRGIMSLAAGDANTMVTVNGVPNVWAEMHTVVDGDIVCAQNYFGWLAFDFGALIGTFSRFFPVGFYYRAFFRPRGAWRFWEPLIRRTAGLGRVDTSATHGYYDKAYLFADVAVLGGGRAGMTAAIASAREGKRVVLIDDAPIPGGRLNYARLDAAGTQAGEERAGLVGVLAATPGIRVMSKATCEGLFADSWLAIVQGHRLYKLRAGAVILATGSREQPAVFRNNDLPGIMLGSAAQRLIKLYGVRPGRRAVVIAGHDQAYGVALDLAQAEIDVTVVELRANPSEGNLRSAVITRGIKIEHAAAITEALGRSEVRALRFARVSEPERVDEIVCDLVSVSVDATPNLALAGHAGARLVYDANDGMRAEGLPETVTVIGSAAAGMRGDGKGVPARSQPIFAHRKGKEFVDFDEDLTIADIEDTVASGFADLELLKRYSTAGMGPSQGRHSAVNTMRIAARARGRPESEIATTTARPPYTGESFGVLAGRSFDPVRRTPMHRRHTELGAKMMPAGAWMRPAYYGTEPNAAIAREVGAVRSQAGLIDVSTLGKIELRGPDAAEFLNRMYLTGHAKQPVGRARYALMTDATGAVTDDGVICRLADAHFFVTATTSGVEAVVRAMYYWNAQWRLDIDVTPASSAYAAVNLAGPRSRDILATVCRDVDLGAAAFPYMGVRLSHVAGVPARILRVGFVGELGYEIHVPAGCGEYVWDRLLEAGSRFGLLPCGVEAQRVLRLEKGHVIIGQDTDGLTSPLEIGMAASPSSKPFFIGAAAIEAHRKRGLTRKLVGFEIDRASAPPKECHLVINGGDIAGRVTSSVRSETLDKTIGLAYVRPEQAETGCSFAIRVDGGRMVEARVVALPFYDPGNERQLS